MMSLLFGGLMLASLVAAAALGSGEALAGAVLTEGYRAVTLSLELMGTVGMWCGVMEIAKRSGLCEKLNRLLSPALSRLFPGLFEKSESARNDITMNVTANLLGLGSAATPSALSAMRELDRLNMGGRRASDDMIKFVVLNTASFQILPTTVAAIRKAAGSSHPFDIIVPVLITSAAALFAAMFAACLLCAAGRKGRV